MTTTPQAATWYRQAQRTADRRLAVAALRLAVKMDPAFAVAVTDLCAVTGALTGVIRGGQMSWERHHIEVVHTAVGGNFTRAADLLFEHLADVGCDPLALRIVIDLRRQMGGQGPFTDLTGIFPGCHPDWRRIA